VSSGGIEPHGTTSHINPTGLQPAVKNTAHTFAWQNVGVGSDLPYNIVMK